ncbi:MAG: L,D-transpeptidase [Acidobacteriota bacterium]
MTERRKTDRPDSPDRRGFPRPPLWLNLTLLVLAVALAGFARVHRDRVDERFHEVLQRDQGTPAEIRQIKADLAQMDLSRDSMAKELDSRMQLVESLKTNEFYLAIDTSKKLMFLQFGDRIAREAPVQIGEPRTVTARNGRTWTFVPIRGGFTVRGKEESPQWEVPEWLYAMNGQPVPAQRPTIPGGLGKYVIYLPNDYVIHSHPSAGSPLKGPRPGSFMVSEEDLKAIWPRVNSGMRVYIF